MRKLSCREAFAMSVQSFLAACTARGYGVTFGEAYRTNEQQELHRSAGRSKVKVSQHQKRLAIDLYIWGAVDGGKEISDEKWLELGKIWLTLSPKNRWGGNFGVKKKDLGQMVGWDRWHFERRN